MPEQRSFGIEGVCLRAQMKREVRCNTFCNSDYGRVVDDECIRSRCIKCCNRFGQIFQIFITHKCIHGDVNFHTAFVRISNGLRNLFKRKIIRKVAQRECGCSEIHGVRAELFDVLRPIGNLEYPGCHDAVVLMRRAAEAQGVDVIEYAAICPHISKCPFIRLCQKYTTARAI